MEMPARRSGAPPVLDEPVPLSSRLAPLVRGDGARPPTSRGRCTWSGSCSRPIATVLGLLATDPFGGTPPRHIRVDRLSLSLRAPRRRRLVDARARRHLAAARLARQRGAADLSAPARLAARPLSAFSMYSPVPPRSHVSRYSPTVETLPPRVHGPLQCIDRKYLLCSALIPNCLPARCLLQFSLATYPEPSDCSRGRTLAGTVSLQREGISRGGDAMKFKQTSRLLFATTLTVAGCGDLMDDTTTTASAALGDRLPGLQADADLLAEADDAFNAFEDRRRRSRTDLQRRGVRPVPHQRRHRRRRRADRAALRPLRQRRLQPARQPRRLVAPAVHARDDSGLSTTQSLQRAARGRAGRGDGAKRRPSDHADLRPRSGGRDARLVLRRPGGGGACFHARCRQPRPDRRSESRRSHPVRRLDARHPLRVEGGRAQPDAVLG